MAEAEVDIMCGLPAAFRFFWKGCSAIEWAGHLREKAFTLLLIGAAILGPETPAISLPDDGTMDFGDWHFDCTSVAGPLQCRMTQSIVSLDGRTHIADIVIAFEDGGFAMNVTLPLGVALVPGIGLSLSGGALKPYEYRTCNSQGCIATIPIDAALDSALAQAKEVRIIYMTLNEGPLAIPMSTKGYANAKQAFGVALGQAQKGQP